MSNNTLIHDGRATGANETQPIGRGELAAEAVDALLAHARDVIAGRVQPPPLPVPPEVERFLQHEFGPGGMEVTPAALRRITERLCLEAIYRGQPVVCVTTPAGTVAVVATGETEIFALLKGLSGEERSKVMFTDTVSY